MKARSSSIKSKERRKDIRLTTLILILVIVYISSISSLYIQTMSELQESSHQAKIAELKQQHADELRSQKEYYRSTIDNLTIALEFSAQYTSELENLIDILHVEYNTEADREFSLYHKYWYVIKNATPGDGITMDLIKYADAVCKEGNLNPHLIWAIVKIESDYDIDIFNTRTDAGGLGQFMEGTGRYVYETILKHGAGSYDHHVTAADPYANIEMMVTYINLLLRNYKGDLAAGLRQYSGGSSTYYNRVAKNMSDVGYSINVLTYI